MKAFSELTPRGRARRARQLVEMALPAYGLAGSRVRFLADDWNVQFRLDTPTGGRYAMRVSNPEEHPVPHTLTEIEWLLDLGADTDLDLVQPIARRDGTYVTTVETEGIPGPRTLVLFSWVPGVPLERRLTPDNYTRFGAAAATLHRHGGTPPAGRDLMAWDRVFYWPEELVIFDPSRADLFPPERMDVVRRVERLVAAELDALPARYGSPQLIHGDLHFWNAHADGSRIWLFDFEDVMAGYPVQDVAITLFYGRDRPDYQVLAESFRRGYETVAPWPARSDQQLRILMAGRTLTFINYMARAADDPEPYLTTATGRLQRLLESL